MRGVGLFSGVVVKIEVADAMTFVGADVEVRTGITTAVVGFCACGGISVSSLLTWVETSAGLIVGVTAGTLERSHPTWETIRMAANRKIGRGFRINNSPLENNLNQH
jgi:hypothetical protein